MLAQPQVFVLSGGDDDNLFQVGMTFSVKVWGIPLEIMGVPSMYLKRNT